jgi:hypothetical protein
MTDFTSVSHLWTFSLSTFPSPYFFLSLSPALGVFHGSATFLGVFTFQLPAWSVLSLSALNSGHVFSGFEIIASLVSNSAQPMILWKDIWLLF